MDFSYHFCVICIELTCIEEGSSFRRDMNLIEQVDDLRALVAFTGTLPREDARSFPYYSVSSLLPPLTSSHRLFFGWLREKK